MLLFIRKIIKSMLLAGIPGSKAIGPGGPNQDRKNENLGPDRARTENWRSVDPWLMWVRANTEVKSLNKGSFLGQIVIIGSF